jgi:thioredoxin reductase (NADPH)
MTGIESERDVENPAAYPRLSEVQLARLRSYGTPQTAEAGEVLYGPGDATYDLIVAEDATVEIVQPATRDAPEESLVRFGPGEFLGELNMLTGQAVYLIARVVEGGRVHRIAPASFRQLMAEDPELSALLLEAFRARREVLRQNGASRGLELVGSVMDSASLALRTYAARRRLPHRHAAARRCRVRRFRQGVENCVPNLSACVSARSASWAPLIPEGKPR